MVSVATSRPRPEDEQLEQHNPKGKADTDEIDCHAWFRLHDHVDPPTGFLHSLEMLADCLRQHGPFDGVLGFSQGGLMAIMVASLLEGRTRREAFAKAAIESSETLPFPASFIDIQHPPFKFGITYGALMGITKKYTPFYEKPRIQTPFCQFSGLYDPVVSSEMTATVNRAQIGGDRSLKILHPGAHAICTDKKYLDTLVQFIRDIESHSAIPELNYNHLVIENPPIPRAIDENCLQKETAFLSSTLSVSDESRSSSRPTKRRKSRSAMRVRRKVSWNTTLVSHSPPDYHDEHRSDASRSDSTSMETSSASSRSSMDEETSATGIGQHQQALKLSMDQETSAMNCDRPKSWLNEALEIFLHEWTQVQATNGGDPPSYGDAREMAVRILRMNMS
jgi:hypothetical protein